MRGFIDKNVLLLLTIASRDLSEENISHSTTPLKLSYRPYLTLQRVSGSCPIYMSKQLYM